MDDDSYESIFVPIISKVMETFQPSAVVLQCGADSLTGKTLKSSYYHNEIIKLTSSYYHNEIIKLTSSYYHNEIIKFFI